MESTIINYKSGIGCFFIFLAILAISVLSACSGPGPADGANEPGSGIEPTRIRLAVCPTYWEQARALDGARYEFIPSASTAQSLDLLASGRADMILSGRGLKPGEAVLDSIVLGQGYAFLAKQEKTLYESELFNYNIYTDLDADEMENIFNLEKVSAVEDIYGYLDQGLLITAWDKADLGRAGIVHVLRADNSRLPLSRRPTLYCPLSCRSDNGIGLAKVLGEMF